MDLLDLINSGTIHILLKKQNLELLKEISKWKELEPDEEREFIRKYHIPDYYMPEMNKNLSVEQRQLTDEQLTKISIFAFK